MPQLVHQQLKSLRLGDMSRPLAQEDVRVQGTARAAQVRATARYRVLAREADGYVGVAGSDAALKLAERKAEIVDIVVGFPAAERLHGETQAAGALKNLRSGGDAVLKSPLQELIDCSLFVVGKH